MANVIKTVLTYQLDGSNRDFNIPFEYLARKFVVVTLIGVDRKVLTLNTDYRFATRTTISLTKSWGPADGYTTIELRRVTSTTDRLVDFTDGSILRAYDLNVAQIQTMHVAEEARDLTADTIGVNNDGHLDARGRRIVNLANAVDDRDAVPFGQLRSMNQNSWQARNEALQFRNETETFRNQAEGFKNESSTNSTNTKQWRDDAKLFRDEAEQLKNTAGQYADAAGSSAGNAKDSEDEARRIAESLKLGYITRRSFEKGFNVITWNEVLLWEEDGEYYRWDGTLPKNVPAGSTPETSGGIGLGAWVSVGDAALRSELSSSSGASIVHIGESTIDQMLYHTPEEYASITTSTDDAITACLNACASDGKRAWLRNHYQIFRTIHVPIGVYVQLDGTIEIMADVDGVHLMRESKLIGGGTVTRSSTLASFTKTAVILYSPRNGRTIGCIDNQVSGIRIMNGWIDYSADSVGTVTDASKMTGRGLCVLAGSWGEGYTTEKSNEYCWKNKVNECFIEGFNTGLELRVYGDDDYTVFVNSNKFSQITFNRCVRNIRLENPGTTANGSLKVEVSGNDFDQIDIQWYRNITTQYVFCSGRQNRFNLHVWDLPASVTYAVVVFQYQTPGAVSPAITFAQPRDNVVEITGINTESTNRSCDRWGTWLFERFQGQNRIVTPGALTQYYVPEDVAPNAHSPLTNHYTATVDDCLLYSTRRKTNPTTVELYVNGERTTLNSTNSMFSPQIDDYATTPTLSTGDYFDLRVNFPSTARVRFAGFSFGELTWATTFTPRIRMYDSSGTLLYDRVFSQSNSVITGHIEIKGVHYMTLSVTGITGSGQFPIARCFMKASNYGSSGFINPSMSTPFIDDIDIDKANGGVVVWTPDGTKRYKISVSNGGSVIATLI